MEADTIPFSELLKKNGDQVRKTMPRSSQKSQKKPQVSFTAIDSTLTGFPPTSIEPPRLAAERPIH